VHVSLQGTFDTLSVTELFGLMSSAEKTGALRLEAGDEHATAIKGTVFVAAGMCCAVESDDAHGPSGSDDELAARLVEVGFSLARCQSGSFRFTDAEHPPFDVVVRTPLPQAAVEIANLLEEWHEIEALLPSLDARVRLASVLRADEIVVSAREWSLLVALEGRPSVRELVAPHGRPMVEVCRTLEELIERGAIEVAAVESTRDPAIPDARVERGRRRAEAVPPEHAHIDVEEPYAPDSDAVTTAVDAIAEAEAADALATAEADAVAAGLVSRMTRNRGAVPDVFASDPEGPAGPAAEPGAVGPGAAADDVPQDRGALLRLFSALKES
jgi:hypothetical protein